MDEEVNTYQEIFQTSDKQRYLQLVLSVAIILIMVMVFVFVAKQNGSLGILSPNKQSQNQPDKTPFELAVEQRIAENGDPSILTLEEQSFIDMTSGEAEEEPVLVE